MARPRGNGVSYSPAAEAELRGPTRRIVYISWVTAIGPVVFLYFVLFRDGYQSQNYMLAVFALVVWLGIGVAALGWTVIGLQKRAESLRHAAEGGGKASHAR